MSIQKKLYRVASFLILALVLAACSTPTPEIVEKIVTQVVEETIIVEGTPQIIEKEVTKIVEVEVEKEIVVTATPEPKPEKKVLYLSSNEYPSSLNPFLGDSASEQEAIYYVHCRLGQFGPDGTIMPFVADWDQSEDGLTYVFHIDKDAKWHDGEPVTAQDIVFTYKLVAHPQSGAVYFSRMETLKGALAFHNGEADDIEGLTIVDDKTVKITLENPSPAFLALTQGAIFLLPEHILGSIAIEDVWDASYWRNPIGCGPYKWVEYVPEQYIHYEKFADYFLGEPKIDEIYMRLGTEEANAIAFEKGDIDIVQLAGTDLERFSEMDYTLHEGQGTVESLVVNTSHPWFDNLKFRKALMYAMDRQAFADAAWFGHSEVAVNPSMTPWTISPNITQYPYDPNMAIELLNEIGWDGSVEFDLLNSPGVAYRDRMSLIMQQNLADVGITMNIVTLEGAAIGELRDSGDFDMTIVGYGSMSQNPWVQFDNFTSTNIPPNGINWSWYVDPVLDELYAQAAVEMDPEKIIQIFNQITERTTDQLPMLPLIIDPLVIAQSDRVDIPNLAYVLRNRPGKNTWLTWNIYEWDIVD
ncbi:MAG: ABC transporter substrate-binding protein [Anaerolineales bacterium]|nr:ABC transporter substrate-binding protein [Anaerolineales bacterium]